MQSPDVPAVPPESADATNRLVRNLKFGSLGSLASMLVSALAASVLFKSLGPVKFGIYTLFVGLSSYIWLLDLGLSRSYVYWFSRYLAVDDHSSVNRLAFYGTTIYFALTAIFMVPAIAYRPAIFAFLRVDSSPELIQAYIVTLVSMLVVVPLNWVSAFLIAAKRADALNIIAIAHQISTNVLLVGAALMHIGFAFFMAAVCLCNVLLILLNLWFIARAGYRVRLTPAFDVAEAKTLFHTSWKFQVDSMSGFIFGYVGKVFLSNRFGPAGVSLYELGSRYANIVGRVVMNAPSVIIPEASDHYVRGNTSELRSLFMRGTFYFAIAYIPIMLLAMYVAKPVISLWLGGSADEAHVVAVYLLLSALFQYSTVFMSPITLATGHVAITMISSVMSTIVFIVVTPFATRQFGVSGLAISNLIGILIGEIYLWVRFHQIIVESSLFDTLRDCFMKPIAVAMCALGVVAFLDLMLRQQGAGIVSTPVFSAALSTAIFGVTYLLISHVARLPVSRLVARILHA